MRRGGLWVEVEEGIRGIDGDGKKYNLKKKGFPAFASRDAADQA